MCDAEGAVDTMAVHERDRLSMIPQVIVAVRAHVMGAKAMEASLGAAVHALPND